MSNLAVNAITDASGGTTASINGYTPSASNMTGRNRIINGAMMIDQRNAGASVNSSGGTQTFGVDRFYTQNNIGTLALQQNTDAPVGFSNSLKITVSSSATPGATDFSRLAQRIEGYNIADLNISTANAKNLALSFWVKSSLTGTFGGSVGTGNYIYSFSYTINAANTWEYKTVSVAPLTGGSTDTTNGNGLTVGFDLGEGSSRSQAVGLHSIATGTFGLTGGVKLIQTSGATFYLTGVQLEVGSTASEFEHRLYGQELALCQRYYEKFASQIAPNAYVSVRTGSFYGYVGWQVPKRAAPTVTLTGTFNFAGSAGDINGVTPGAFDTQTVSNSRFYLNSGTYTAQSAYVYINTSLEIISEL